MEIKIESEFASLNPGYRVILMEADVEVSPVSDDLKREMARLADDMASRLKVEDINKLPAIAATRRAYKACGKDPNRYRPSQEQLMRRIVRGLGLYNVNSLVDAGNMLSLKSGCSVGCFDADKVAGDGLTIGMGRAAQCEGSADSARCRRRYWHTHQRQRAHEDYPSHSPPGHDYSSF